jgi:hypothetical protein
VVLNVRQILIVMRIAMLKKVEQDHKEVAKPVLQARADKVVWEIQVDRRAEISSWY